MGTYAVAGATGMYHGTAGATGTYAAAKDTGTYAAAAGATGMYAAAGATGTYATAGATGMYGGAGATAAMSLTSTAHEKVCNHCILFILFNCNRYWLVHFDRDLLGRYLSCHDGVGQD